MVKRKIEKCFFCRRQIKGVRYIVRSVCYAACDNLEICPWDLSADLTELIRREIKKIRKISGKKLNDEIAKCWEFSLCGRCAAEYRKNPAAGRRAGWREKKDKR